MLVFLIFISLQVHELHRLYRVQITLMKDLGCKEFGRYNSCKESTQSSPMPETNAISYEPPLKEPRFSSISMVKEAVYFLNDMIAFT